MRGPRRIVCLTEEPTETIYLLGESARIVGISGFTVRPPGVRSAHPRVSAFLTAKTDRILALKPDFVIGWSDLQADIARDLISAGVEVFIANHRSVAEILDYIIRLGGLIDAATKAQVLVDGLQRRLESIAKTRRGLAVPRVYFEEWDEPPISAIRWVSELVEVAGGRDIFPELAKAPLGRDRIIADPRTIIDRDPEVVIASWCGKRFNAEAFAARPGFDRIAAVRAGAMHEIRSPLILQPGPAALTDGLDALVGILDGWRDSTNRL